MKKVLVLAAVAALFAAPAFAGIATTKHDLSSGGTSAYKGATAELCVYCHTPHGGSTGGGNAPLWNRSVIASTAVYNSATLQAAPTTASVDASDAGLCLSCHDGTSLTVAVTNPPNGSTATGASNIVGAANLGTDLSNDHPVGFSYPPAGDTEILASPGSAKVKVTYGTGGDQMWCSSCHDVHSNTYSPFLVTTNAGSALCLDCHSK